MDYITIWAAVSTIGMVVFGYLNYRKAEVITFALDVVESYKDKVISEDEYKKLSADLEAILYKK